MADANVPEAVDSAVKADVAAPKPTAGGSSSLADGAVPPKADVSDVSAKAPAPAQKLTTQEPEAPQAVAQVPVEAKDSAKPTSGKPKPVRAAAVKPVSQKTAKVAKPARKQAAPKPKSIPVTNKASSIPQLKDKIMATSKTPDFSKGIQDAIADAQGRAKAAFEKGTASLGEVTEFTKGNVEAMVESGKIFASGAQSLGSTYVADSRAAFETMTADMKELASAKNPADFFKLQGDLARRNFDTAIAAGSKNSEALFKLMNEAFAPLSGRMSLAVDKIKQAA